MIGPRQAALGAGVVVAWLSGCVTPMGGVNPAAAAAMTSAVALGASGISRASGGCYAACPTGTSCNAKTGLCDALPCRGLCASNERCEMSGVMERCMPGAEVDLHIERPGDQTERITPR